MIKKLHTCNFALGFFVSNVDADKKNCLLDIVDSLLMMTMSKWKTKHEQTLPLTITRLLYSIIIFFRMHDYYCNSSLPFVERCEKNMISHANKKKKYINIRAL